MALASVAFYQHSLWLMLTVLFLMGLHSTLFGPIKYAILPQALHPDELVGGNALVETGTSLAILIGMIAGGVGDGGRGPGRGVDPRASRSRSRGYLVCRAIPPAPPTAPDLKFNWNPFTETVRVLGFVTKNRTVFNSVLGISWFWFFGGVFTMQLPNYTKIFLGGTESVSILVLALFSIGVGAGSLLCEKLSGRTRRDRPRAVRLDRPHAVRRSISISRARRRRRCTSFPRSRSSPRPAAGASCSTSSSSACSPASTSCRCSRWCRAARRRASSRA